MNDQFNTMSIEERIAFHAQNPSHATLSGRGKNKASANVKNGRNLLNEKFDKNAVSVGAIDLAEEYQIDEMTLPLVIGQLRRNYGLAVSSLPRWRDTGIKVRQAAANQAMLLNNSDNVIAFTIVFSHRLQDSITKQASKKKGVTSLVSKILRRGFEAGGIATADQVFWFNLEAKPDKNSDNPTKEPAYRLYHVHGVMVVPSGMSDDDFGAALKKAGGKEERFDNQINCRELWFAQGWGKYSAKQIAKMQAHTGDNCFGMSAACKAIGEQRYTEIKDTIDNLIKAENLAEKAEASPMSSSR